MLLETLENQIEQDVRTALEEDLGSGDITAQLIPANRVWKASVVSRESAILCGRNWFDAVFHRIDPEVDIRWTAQDGDSVEPDQVLCTLKGAARSLLSGERVALNFLQTLSGTATRVNTYVRRIGDLDCKLLDTRKTIPGLRRAQKYAVRCGGGHNHRMGLYDAFLIKENHIAAAGSIAAAVASARALHPDMPVEVEVENPGQLQQALDAGAEQVLLDNFSTAEIRAAVTQAGTRTRLETSGGINLDNLRDYAETGVHFISIGALTKDLQSIDLSMRFD